MQKFEELQFPTEYLSKFHSQNLFNLNKLQQKLLNMTFKGSNVITIAPEGVGKTIGFLTAIINKIFSNIPQDTQLPIAQTMAIILVPFKESVLRVQSISQKLIPHQTISICAIHEQTDTTQIQMDLRGKPNIIITTPEKFIECYEQNFITLSGINFIVLNEIDKLIDKGNLQIIQMFFRAMRSKSQALIFSSKR